MGALQVSTWAGVTHGSAAGQHMGNRPIWRLILVAFEHGQA
jgi:hypothetical protein